MAHALRGASHVWRASALPFRGRINLATPELWPVAAKLLDPDGGKEFVRLNAQLIAAHTLGTKCWEAAPFSAPLTDRLNHMLNAALQKQQIPRHIAGRRLILASVMLFHGLADYSRVLEASGVLDEANVYSFTADLEAMMVAALIAPLDLREK